MACPGCGVGARGYLRWEFVEDLAEVAGALAAGSEISNYLDGGDERDLPGI